MISQNESNSDLQQGETNLQPSKIGKSGKLWGKLKKFLLKKDEFSLREQLYLNLIARTELPNEILEYSINNILVRIKQQKATISLDEAKKFNSEKVDSTGVSLWPAEEVLAYFCSKNINLLSTYSHIAEFGAGYSGLAGITLAKLLLSGGHINFKLEISDGNELCSQLLNENLALNSDPKENCSFRTSVYSCQRIWGLSDSPLTQFDCILIADCLFFRNYHDALIETLKRDLLPNKGTCIIIAPSRGGTLKEFLQKCEGKLAVESFEFTDELYAQQKETIQKREDYSSDMHDYYFFKLRNICS